jgi:hypothetical protein
VPPPGGWFYSLFDPAKVPVELRRLGRWIVLLCADCESHVKNVLGR